MLPHGPFLHAAWLARGHRGRSISRACNGLQQSSTVPARSALTAVNFSALSATETRAAQSALEAHTRSGPESHHAVHFHAAQDGAVPWTRSSGRRVTKTCQTRRRGRAIPAYRRSSAHRTPNRWPTSISASSVCRTDGGVTNRTGTRHGPRAVRDQSSLLRRIHPTTLLRPFEAARVRDLGDCWIEQPYALEGALDEIAGFYRTIIGAGVVPLSVGGDHSISLPILRAVAAGRPVGMIHIDAHCDTGDDYMGSRFHHGAPFRRATEEGLLDPKRVIQIGIRGTVNDPDMWGFSTRSGMRVLLMEEFHDKGWQFAAEEARRIAGSGPTYLSFDIDSLDPVAGTGHRHARGRRHHRARGASPAARAARHRLCWRRSGGSLAAIRRWHHHIVQRRIDPVRNTLPAGRILAGAQAGLANTRRSDEDVDKAVVSEIVATQRPWRISSRRGRRLGPVLAISLWLHLTLLLLALVTVRYGPAEEEELPPPATVAMVFEGGQPQGPAVPRQQLLPPTPASPAPPPAPAPAPRAAVEPPPPAPPPAPAAPAPTPAAPSPPPPPVPQPVPQVSTEAPPPAPSPPPAAEALPLPPPHAATGTAAGHGYTATTVACAAAHATADIAVAATCLPGADELLVQPQSLVRRARSPGRRRGRRKRWISRSHPGKALWTTHRSRALPARMSDRTGATS